MWGCVVQCGASQQDIPLHLRPCFALHCITLHHIATMGKPFPEAPEQGQGQYPHSSNNTCTQLWEVWDNCPRLTSMWWDALAMQCLQADPGPGGLPSSVCVSMPRQHSTAIQNFAQGLQPVSFADPWKIVQPRVTSGTLHRNTRHYTTLYPATLH